jgi:hypothetical protein
MIIKIEKIQSKHLDIINLSNKELSIQFSLDGFSFCVIDLDLLDVVSYCNYSFEEKNHTPENLLNNIKALFLQEPILQSKFVKVNVIHENNLSTLVPKPLFDENNLSDYIKFNTKIFTNDFFAYDSINNNDMVNVFVPFVNVNNFLIDQFGSFEYKHYSTILIENLLNNHTNNEITFFVNVSKNHFEIVVSNNKKLLLYNTFDYTTKEDFIYYILFVVEQLQLNTEELSLLFLGEIKKDDELYEIAYKYIRNISFVSDKFEQSFYLHINDSVRRENFTLFQSV